jgi:membrane protein
MRDFRRDLQLRFEQLRRTVWDPNELEDRSAVGRLRAVARVIWITVTGLLENKAASRAAALSFSSLLGLGPLVALAMLVAGFMLDDEDPHLAVNTLNRLIRFVAPQVIEYEKAAQGLPPADRTDRQDVLAALGTSGNDEAPAPPIIEVRPELVELIDGFVASSRSGAVGAIGALVLILIVLQLFTSIETTFNDIWGVRRGRSWLMRVVYYWTVLTLGAVLFFAALTGLGAGAFLNAFAGRFPYGDEVAALLQTLLPASSFIMLLAVLTLFYRGIPNTRVLWGAAFIGALVVTICILINNALAFVYFKRVVLSRSLYGSLGILPVLMFGLYVFWFIILLGGQVSYAVQNARYRNSQAAWHSLADRTRERLSLLVLLTIGRRFHDCQTPLNATELGLHLKVPTQILNACLSRLVQMGLLSTVAAPEEPGVDKRYQPARPLHRITLASFKQLDDDCGVETCDLHVETLDPLVGEYSRAQDTLLDGEFFRTSLDRLFELHPLPTASGAPGAPTPALPSAAWAGFPH